MAPRKRVEKSANIADETVVKKGRKPNASNLGKTSSLRIEIPSTPGFVTNRKTSQARVVIAQNFKSTASHTKSSKSRIVTTPNMNNKDIKVMLANEVVQAHFSKTPIVTDCQPQKPNMKRKPAPKRVMVAQNLGKKKVTQVIANSADSDGSASEDTSEPKRKKARMNVLRKQKSKTSDTPEAATLKKNKTVQNVSNKLKNYETPTKLNKSNSISSNALQNDFCKSLPTMKNIQKSSNNTEKSNVKHYKTRLNQREGKSTLSTSDCLSPLKDISENSNTSSFITVHSNEFVCFDNKYPVVRLKDCHKLGTVNINENCETLTDIESTVGKCTYVEESASSIAMSGSRLLSLSSLSSSSESVQKCETNESNAKIDEVLNKLTSHMKKFDLEIMNWIGYANEKFNGVNKSIRDRFCKFLIEESDVIAQCQNIKKLLLDEDSKSVVNEQQMEDNDDENDQTMKFLKPVSVNNSKRDKSVDLSEINNSNTNTEEAINAKEDGCNDDDDALSLFAESISGFDSSYRKNSSLNSVTKKLDEYLPHPITDNCYEKRPIFTYEPTKIIQEDFESLTHVPVINIINEERNIPHEPLTKPTIVCEKQNADSTSVSRDVRSSHINDLGSAPESSNICETYPHSPTKIDSTPINPKPLSMMASISSRTHRAKSLVLEGVCFFNLLQNCTKSKCRFTHARLDSDLVKYRIKKLDKPLFIQEYLLIKRWSALRRSYGLLFVFEAIKRQHTEIVLEMAMDFAILSNPNLKEDVHLRIVVLENVLLYLNGVDISTYAELLTYTLANGECICDIFMHTLAETQNFSRFKTIFINLTHFMYKIQREFNFDVASLLLERVCILPFEEQLAWALLNVIRKTSTNILKSSMICKFEELLSGKRELSDQLQALKNETVENSFLLTQPSFIHDDHSRTSMLGEYEKRCSPDTTNFDQLNKTRTCDLNRIWLNDQCGKPSGVVQNTTFRNIHSHNSDLAKSNQWSHNTIPERKIMTTKANLATPMSFVRNFKRPLDEHRVQYGNSSSNYPRRYDPDFT